MINAILFIYLYMIKPILFSNKQEKQKIAPQQVKLVCCDVADFDFCEPVFVFFFAKKEHEVAIYTPNRSKKHCGELF